MNKEFNRKYNPVARLKNIIEGHPKAYLFVKNEWSGILEDLPKYDYNDDVARELCHMVIMDLIDEEIITSI